MSEQGFTLVESLVALAIIGIAAAGIVGAVERHVDTVRGLEVRAGARWAAENRLAEMALAPGALATPGGEVEMLGQRYSVTATTRSSADPDLRLVEVAAGPVGAAPLVRLQGFVDAGTTTR